MSNLLNMTQNNNDFNLVFNAVSKNGLLLENISPNFKNNITIVLAAIKNNYDAFKFASEKLQNDKYIHCYMIIKYEKFLKNQEKIFNNEIDFQLYKFLYNIEHTNCIINKKFINDNENLILSNIDYISMLSKFIEIVNNFDIEIINTIYDSSIYLNKFKKCKILFVYVNDMWPFGVEAYNIDEEKNKYNKNYPDYHIIYF